MTTCLSSSIAKSRVAHFRAWIIFFLVLIASSSIRAQTQDAAEDRAGEREKLALAIVKQNDANGDGKISLDEAPPGLKRLFPRLDVNGDDRVDLGEIVKSNLRLRAGGNRGQLADTAYRPLIKSPAFEIGKGPVVLLDEAHFNYHKLEGRYAPFVRLLRLDGYRVKASKAKLNAEVLAGADVLVIANPLAAQNERKWSLPTPSAFSTEEINAVVVWVKQGGALILIADHMPFAGAAHDLASALGARFTNGFALPVGKSGGRLRFDRQNGQLLDHAITRGRNANERIDHLVSFTGSAFQVDEEFQPLFRFGPKVVSLQPKIAWRFSDATPRTDVRGWCQGAVRQLGQGRLAIFGEAAMFSAQRTGTQRRPMGMNDPDASQNAQFLLNTLHWLTRVIP